MIEDSIRYNSDGEELVKQGELWIPKSMIMTKEEQEKYYARFSHPKINPIYIVLNVIIPIIIGVITFFLLELVFTFTISLIVTIALEIVYLFLSLKRIAVFIVKLYQIFAPMRIREKCVFTPTCSDYMIMALKKYGFFRGLKKGLHRIKACSGAPREDLLK